MRVGGWSVAAVLAALLTAAAASALRPTTAEGVSRSRRRFTSTTAQDDDITISSSPSSIGPSSIRPRTYSRRIENTPREVTRPRTRGRPITRNTDSNVPVTSPENVSPSTLVERTERINLKNGSSRIRKRPIERNKKIEDTSEGSAQTNTQKNNLIKSRTRQSFRRAPTQSPLDVSSPNIDESKIEVISSTLDEITKMTFKDNAQSTSPLSLDITSSKGTRSTPFTPDSENPTTKRIRSRLMARVRSSPSDLISLGTINSVSYMDKVTTARSIPEFRDSRKLRYRTRLSESDTNLTGQGITVANEVINSSQILEKNTSHKENNPESTTLPKISASTESSHPSSTLKTANFRRPPRGKANFRPVASLPKINTDPGAISEDDNYPESFKALLQAKNSSLQSSSPARESLSVIASNKVYKTHTPPSQSVNTDPEKTQIYPRFITKKSETAKIYDEDKSVENSTTTTPSPKLNRKAIFKSRSPYSSNRYRKNSTVTTTTAIPSNIQESSSDQPRYKYNRKFKISTTSTPRYTQKFNSSSVARNKPLPRSSYYSRFKSTTIKEAATTESVPLNNEKKINFEITANDAIHENVEKNEIGELNTVTNKTVETSTLSRIAPIRNIHSRKSVFSSRNSNFAKQKQYDMEPNTNESKMRMYSESLQKATTASNSIATPEPEKNKGRFSSKYKAPLDKPLYKATVPSITSSTVEGEENQLGPDTNSISFSQTRSTLTSGDLKLSESILSSSPLMNVEASHYSPSVTISIFDALAEILTSTPRPQMSSTTEVKSKTDSNLAIKNTLNGVSNSINVNNFQELETEEKLISADVNSNRITKPVQITSQTKQNMINRLTSRAVSSSSPNSEQQNRLPIDTSNPTPTPIPTTPLSARKPFAIKLLYSATDSSTDNLSTTTELTSNRPATDNPSTVYNTVSDLILSNNNLVSSELTSMLSNNIRDILQNMDESTRTKVSVEMTNLLRTLIPRALSRLSTDTDNNIPNTTPYSLEDIRDTEVEFDPNTEIPQIVISGDVATVNNVTDFRNTSVDSVVNAVPVPAVNSFGSTLEVSNTSIITNTRLQINDETATDLLNNGTFSAPIIDNAFDSNVISRSIENASNFSSSVNNTNNQDQSRIPFFTNFRVTDESSHELSNDNEASVEISNEELLQNPSPNPLVTPLDSSTQKPCDLSPVQLWVLSKKARVLKMIEDIIRDHNREISASSKTVQNVDYISSISTLSEQLAHSNPSMKNLINSLQFNSNTGLETTTLPIDSNVPSTPFAPVNLATTMNMQLEIDFKSRIAESGSTTEENNAVSTNMSAVTRALVTTVSPFVDVVSTPASQESTVTDSIFTTLKQDETTVVAQPESVLTTTESVNPAITTPINADILTRLNSENINEAERSTIHSSINVTTTTTSTGSLDIVNTKNLQTSLPKKDYIIFGILPNNTVVRKDPNDETLESLTEASPYIVYGVLPNNTIIRRFPNGTRVPRVMPKIDVLPISPWSLRNPYSPIHNNPAIVRPQSNLFRLSTNVVTSIEPSSNGSENQSNNTVNNNQDMISSTTLNINNRSSLGADVTTGTSMAPAEKSTASHVLSLRTTTMLPSIDEILLNSISTAAKEEMVLSTMKSSTSEPRILTLDIDPETKQIRTEKPMDGSGSTVFKFIPIDEIMVSKQGSNVLKLASTKAPNIVTSFGTTETQTELTTLAVTEVNTQPPQITADIADSVETTTFATEISRATSVGNVETKSNSLQNNADTEKKTMPFTTLPVFTNSPTSTAVIQEAPTTEDTLIQPLTLSARTATASTTLTPETTIVTSTSSSIPITTQQFRETTFGANETPPAIVESVDDGVNEDVKILQSLIQGTIKNQPNIAFTNIPLPTITTPTTTGSSPILGNRLGKQQQVRLDDAKLLQAILLATAQNPIDLPNTNTDSTATTTTIQNSSTRSIEDDIRQFEEDTKLLKALLQATGQDPASIRIPTLNGDSISLQGTQFPLTTTAATTTSTTTTTTTTSRPVTTNAPTTFSIKDDIRKFQEDAKLLQALLQATGQNVQNFYLPVVNGVTSNVRVSNPLTTSVTAPTTQLPTTTKVLPVYTSRTRATTNIPPVPTVTTTTFESRNIFPLTTAFQPKKPTLSTTAAPEDAGISTTFPPYTNLRRRLPTTTTINGPIFTTTNAELPIRAALPTARRIVNTITTEIPSTSTFSVQEDIVFLNNLKNVLNTDTDDPEKKLANRIVALAVERSLNEIQSGESVRSGKAISNVGASFNQVRTTTVPTTTTTTTTRPTTTPRPTTTTTNTPSIEDDIKQFQEDTKLLQALIKATGQDPANFNIPTITNAQTNVRTSNRLSETVNDELKLLGNLLASPSPLNEPFDSLTPKPNSNVDSNQKEISIDLSSTRGPSIATRQNVQDDDKLIETLIQIQGSQETTTQKSKLAVSGLTGDEALSTLLKQSNKVSDATKTPVRLSTEYGNSNDALLAALLKEQGFGPTTASSLDEQLRLAALLNQVVVTPKARRTTTPPPPPAPRRPLLDGLAWLWQQWRETAPGPAAARPNRRPMVASPASPARPPSPAQAPQTSVNWFGSGPFVGNAEEKPTSNRIPLEPPGAVAAEQTPGRGQLVSAAINVTRAFSQFLGAAIQGAAQTVQNVIKAGQRAASDVYTNGSG